MGTYWLLTHVALPAWKVAGVVLIWVAGFALIGWMLRHMERRAR